MDPLKVPIEYTVFGKCGLEPEYVAGHLNKKLVWNNKIIDENFYVLSLFERLIKFIIDKDIFVWHHNARITALNLPTQIDFDFERYSDGINNLILSNDSI